MCEIIYEDIYEGNFLTVKNCNNINVNINK